MFANRPRPRLTERSSLETQEGLTRSSKSQPTWVATGRLRCAPTKYPFHNSSRTLRLTPHGVPSPQNLAPSPHSYNVPGNPHSVGIAAITALLEPRNQLQIP